MVAGGYSSGFPQCRLENYRVQWGIADALREPVAAGDEKTRGCQFITDQISPMHSLWEIYGAFTACATAFPAF
jgi:hypothetical protein